MARASRGFTLVELLVGTVTTAIILSAVAVTFVGVQGSYQTEARINVAVEGVRTATGFIEQRLRMAGYGVDPRFAFDFDAAALPSGMKANFHVVLGKGLPDSVTDDLAFRYRDAAWMRRGSYSAGITLREGSSFGMNFPAGQRFIVSCMGGKDYLVVKSTGAVSTDATAISGLSVDTALSSVTSSAPCLSRTGDSAPYILLLHEIRLRIVALEGRPFLMAFRGFDTLDMTTAVPLAADVESFQVAYVMNRPSTTSPHAALPAVDSSSSVMNWVLGDEGSADADRIPDPNALPAPVYSTPYEAPARYNRHPANIRAVRLSISLRSTSPESSKRRAFARVALEDSGEAAPADGFYRTNMTTTVRVPNLLSRSAFNPPVGGEDPAGNVWGG
ncbi:PilW family protein [Archangium sp.]|uniref:PilW family protein n=1 Tax=Archangium sp. TaxID=1872627 RepID=UPI002D33D221|nr:PilW family protein [Archangium sp.]HYO59486.1 PilW family protein [Archangium sp.]